jgi:hypothetical protein
MTANKLEGGKLTTYITGQGEVILSDYAEWSISGPSPDVTNAKWTGLQFKLAPVPMPGLSEIFDRNGDGIGDSITIEFSKSFRGDSGNDIRDSLLLVLLEVIWEKGDTVRFHAPEFNVDSLKNREWVRRQYASSGFRTTNGNYWRKFVKGDSLHVLMIGGDAKFSKGIATSGYNGGKGLVLSYTPFYDEGVFQYSPESGMAADLLDKIPPIVVSARFTFAKGNASSCKDDKQNGCREELLVALSEPVFSAAGADEFLIKNPFSYCLGLSQKENCPISDTISGGENDWRSKQSYDNLDWGWELPGTKHDFDVASSATYRPSNSGKMNNMTPYSLNVTKGDSVVDMVYKTYKIDQNTGEETRTPKGEDWVKLRSDIDIFRDANGNKTNPRERGVLIKGSNPSGKEHIRIAAIKPGTKPEDPPLDGIFKDPGRTPIWFTESGRKEAEENLFKPGNVAEFLPVPKEYSTPQFIKDNYPGSVGTLFITNDLRGQVDIILTSCEDENRNNLCSNKNGDPLTKENIAEGITIHASAHYHTNLGNYTADRKNVVANCTNPIFQNAKTGKADCYNGESNFYLAWDLKTNNNRFVGAGAYVAISKFYVQIEYKKGPSTVVKKIEQQEFIEMFGVSRGSIVLKGNTDNGD